MINRRTLFVVISVSLLLVLGGCSALTGNPREDANEAIAEANDSIAEHNRLFEQARSTYADVKEKVESGDDPGKEKERVTEAKETLQEARGKLEDARESLATVQDLDVDSEIKEYARLLTQAMDAQLDAEAKEIDFYEILELDPALENNREKALDLLSEVGDGYNKADEAYAKARRYADARPKLIQPAPREG
jgi:DNA repair exonuclease SbcCD ATPase subunit